MERRFIFFIVLSVLILIGNAWIQGLLRGNKPPQQVAQKQKEAPKADPQVADQPQAKEAPAGEPAPKQPPAQGDVAANEAPEAKPEWFTLGSADPSENNPYRLLVTLTNRGAAVERIELSSPRFRDLEFRRGYLGNLNLEPADGGMKVNIVGPGTPAAVAGMKAGDVITSCDGAPISGWQSIAALEQGRPGQKVELGVRRDGKPLTLSATLGRRPLEVVRPQRYDPKQGVVVAEAAEADDHDPLSFLLTMFRVDNDEIVDDKLETELPGVQLRSRRWDGKQIDPETIEFTRALPKYELEIVKRYRIAKVQPDKPAYHLTLDVELRNTGSSRRLVAYQLDGPTGLPTEGWWYTIRVSRDWGGAGIRDVAMKLQNKEPALISPMQLIAGNLEPKYRNEEPNQLLAYVGVDAQYFASALIPVPFKDRDLWLVQIKGVLVGKLPPDPRFQTLADVTCRLVSVASTLEPGGPPLKHTYTVFAGPKQPALLAQYGDPNSNNNLGELIYYGWPIWAIVARPMTKILHFFYGIVGNYGIAIVLLTVVVRGCMFPLSRKQALSAQKMQELKPEMDRINEKYKGKPEERTRATRELWRKHNHNPFAGCLPLFLQLPIFIGLYRALMIDVELRQAPLFGEGIAWCSNLAAPDMFAHWRSWPFMPGFITAYKGLGSLGPYLNILPLVTVGLMIWQQKMFMPPATDDQTRAQQKMMKYMMIVIAFMFFTVPSGLCIYFIASSLWAIAERKFLPKTTGAKAGGHGALAARSGATSDDGNGAARRDRKRQPGK